VSESEKSLADLTAQKQLSEGEVTKFKGEVTTLNAKVTDLTTQLATKDSELGVKTTELQAKDEKITALEKKAEDATLNPPAVTDDSKAQMAELETLKTKLETELAGAQSKIKSLEEKALEKKKSQDLKTLTGRILAVNQAWNFVVLNIGNRNGIESNSEFLVRRGTTLIGKVRITTVEPANSIADIVPGSLKQGLSIQPGDDVIFQTERN